MHVQHPLKILLYHYMMKNLTYSLQKRGEDMKTVLDVRNLLKKFGVFIYTGDRIGDLELMQAELKGLYEVKLIDVMTYQNAIVILKKEISDLRT